MRSKTLIAATLPLLSAIPIQAATICNGHAELCDRSYGNITFIGAHDSYAVGSNLADNQDKDVTSQLNDGIRTLQVQTHNASDGIHLCHSSCSLLDAGLLQTYLTTVADWVNTNPNEVISLVLVNIDNLPPTSFSPIFQSSGLSSKTYSPPSASLAPSDWPTLGTLIDAGTTVVAFMDNSADFSEVPYLVDEFSNMWEDAYDVTTADWYCAVNRTTGSAASQMMLVNHFLDTTYTIAGNQIFVPDKANIETTNSEDSITTHVSNCQSVWGRNPNHILLDFYDSNLLAPFNLAATLNGVSAPTNTIIQGNVTSNTTTTSTASGSSESSAQTAVVSSTPSSGGSLRWSGMGMGKGLMGLIGGGGMIGLGLGLSWVL